jgi:SNF2 family DNA or RNA helicase
MEYWCMIDFAVPGLLEDRKEFSKKFAQVIQRGLFLDSDPQEVSSAKVKLKVLTSKLDPFVQRKDASVLEKDLPKKEEFVISCRMTPFQHEVYQVSPAPTRPDLGFQ